MLNRKGFGIETRTNPKPSDSQLFTAEDYRRPAGKTAGKVILNSRKRDNRIEISPDTRKIKLENQKNIKTVL
ncbi:hypothetical protein ACSAZL_21830 [Methanosarcina sp. T3]|uniref:hypothetical protein n=1 Tax=Methanosarcina sp. T3 TaxID=3439062 RepID=UPI003F85D7AC